MEEETTESEDPGLGLARPLACTLAVIATPIALGLFIPWLIVGPSSTGWLYVVGMILIWSGMLTSPWRRTRHRGMMRLGGILVGIAVVVRMFAAPDGDSMRMERIPQGNLAAEVANRLIPERDSALVGGWLILHTTHFVPDVDGTFLQAMSEGYRRMNEDQGIVGSPWAATYLGMQSRDSFDMQVFEADSKAAVIFLHGFGGNFTMPCWEVAQAAAMADVATFCPSTEWQGRWWLGGSVSILREAMAHVREQGYERVYLAGLSNGGIGLSRIAPRLVDEVDGFVFISGISGQAEPVEAPTLVIHGNRDLMTETSIARNYAKRAPFAKYVEIDGGHFILVEDRDVIRPRIADWLRVQTP